jgi:tetratricopeptide (TPR) repeat protein
MRWRNFACALAVALAAQPAWATGYSSLNTAIAALNERRDDDAIRYFGEAIAAPDLPKNFLPLAYLARATAYLESGQLSAAATDCDASLRLRPDWFDSLEVCGAVHLQTHDDASAIANFTAAIAIRPDLGAPHFALAAAYDDKGDFDTAIAEDAKVIALLPDSPAGYSARARDYELQGRYDLALADRKAALGLADDDYELVRAVGVTQWALGQFSDAESSFHDAWRSRHPSLYSLIWGDIASAAVDPTKKPDAPSASDVDLTTWPAPIVNYFDGAATAEDVMAAAAKGSADDQNNQRCEANFYVAEWRLRHNSPDPVKPLLEDAVRNCPRDYIEYVAATIELKRLKP